MSELVQKARLFAANAHAAVKQCRKYTNEPYIMHPYRVASLVSTVPHTDEMLAAAWLHDTVEDTHVSLEEIEEKFGDKIAAMVSWLTDQRPTSGGRAIRIEQNRLRLADAPPEVKTIKLADLLDNVSCIAQYDAQFAFTYLDEKYEALKVLTQGDPSLFAKTHESILLCAAQIGLRLKSLKTHKAEVDLIAA
jgi:(p)ppGpp synthase/HD superfamily hydrolase